MLIHRSAAIATIVLAVLACTSIRAQDSGAPIYNYSSVQAQTAVLDRMEELEAEVASLRRELLVGGGCDGCADKGCGSCGIDNIGKAYACGPRIDFRMDVTLLRFHKTGGVQTGSDMHTGKNPELVELGFIASPRFNLRFYRPNGMFVEASFFQFNHSAQGAGMDALTVNAYTFDLKFGQDIKIDDNWTMTWTGGPRRFRYEERLVDADELEFNVDSSKGIGGVVSLFAKRRIGPGLLIGRVLQGWDRQLFGGATFAIVHGDHRIRENRGVPTDIRFTDENWIQMEIATGTEMTRTLANGAEIYFRWGVEWITYENASSQFAGNEPGLGMHENSVEPGADVGFGGFTAALGFRW